MRIENGVLYAASALFVAACSFGSPIEKSLSGCVVSSKYGRAHSETLGGGIWLDRSSELTLVVDVEGFGPRTLYVKDEEAQSNRDKFHREDAVSITLTGISFARETSERALEPYLLHGRYDLRIGQGNLVAANGKYSGKLRVEVAVTQPRGCSVQD